MNARWTLMIVASQRKNAQSVTGWSCARWGGWAEEREARSANTGRSVQQSPQGRIHYSSTGILSRVTGGPRVEPYSSFSCSSLVARYPHRPWGAQPQLALWPSHYFCRYKGATRRLKTQTTSWPDLPSLRSTHKSQHELFLQLKFGDPGQAA